MATPSYDGAAAAASVIMSPTVRARPVLFVEGVCEVRLFAHHHPAYEPQVIPCGGHTGVKDAIAAVEKWEAANNSTLMVLGFIDRDYGSRCRHRRITISNHRDVEIDMYKSKAGEKLLKEKASRSKCPDARAAVEEAIDALRAVGLVRKYNADNKKRWRIKEIDLERCIDSKGTLNTEKFLSLLQQKNLLGGSDLASLQQMLRLCADVMTESVIRGHDVSTLLGKWLRQRIGNRSKAETSWDAMEENLRLATEHEELLRYHWARRIKEHLIRQI